VQLNTFRPGYLQTPVEIVFCVNGMLSWPMRVLDSNVTCLAFKILVPVGSGDVRATVVRHDFICCVLGD
jgi:hypothetical protein